MRKDYKLMKLIVSFGIVIGTGLAGGIVTARSINDWYPTLITPSFNPPNWVFAPVWTILYILIALSLYVTWTAKKHNWFALSCFTLNLILNFLWSVLFFGLHDIRSAFIVMVCLWISIVVMIVKFVWVDKRASYLLVPYFVWVSFALVLNYSIMILNG